MDELTFEMIHDAINSSFVVRGERWYVRKIKGNCERYIVAADRGDGELYEFTSELLNDPIAVKWD